MRWYWLGRLSVPRRPANLDNSRARVFSRQYLFYHGSKLILVLPNYFLFRICKFAGHFFHIIDCLLYINVFDSCFNVLYKPDLWKKVCCMEDRLLKNLLNINLAILQIVLFSVSGET